MTRPSFRAAAVTVEVPATSANLGPGFDVFGLGLEMRDVIAAQVLDEAGLDLDIAGEEADNLRRDAKHLVVRAMYAAFDAMGGRPRGLAIRCGNLIPHGRGLGSSAAAIVGGMVLARALVLGGNERLSDDQLLALATEMEGHPDNVAAALFGGATISWMEDGVGKGVRLYVDPSIAATVFVPTASVATSKARKLLPEKIEWSAAVHNVSRSTLLAHALSQRPDLLFTATEDQMHQEARKSAMPRSYALVTKLRADGLAAVISGAGPSVLVLHVADLSVDWSAYAGSSFAVHTLALASEGARVAR